MRCAVVLLLVFAAARAAAVVTDGETPLLCYVPSVAICRRYA